MKLEEYNKLKSLTEYNHREELEKAAEAFSNDYDYDEDSCFDPQEAVFDAFIEGAFWLLDQIQLDSN